MRHYFFHTYYANDIYFLLCRPPLNLLRQEITGTSIYLDTLHKSTSGSNRTNNELQAANGPTEIDSGSENSYIETKNPEEKLNLLAEEKLISFCGQVLKEASDLQPGTIDGANADVHRVLDLRAPVIVKVFLLLFKILLFSAEVKNEHFFFSCS